MRGGNLVVKLIHEIKVAQLAAPTVAPQLLEPLRAWG
jgi:hypothetical protein